MHPLFMHLFFRISGSCHPGDKQNFDLFIASFKVLIQDINKYLKCQENADEKLISCFYLCKNVSVILQLSQCFSTSNDKTCLLFDVMNLLSNEVSDDLLRESSDADNVEYSIKLFNGGRFAEVIKLFKSINSTLM